MAVGDAYVFPGFLTPVLTQLFFPKPPTTFLTRFCRGERRKYAREKSCLNLGSNSQPPGHQSDMLTTEPTGRGIKFEDVFLAHLSTECSVSYCDHSPSVVVRPSVHNLLVNTLPSTNINQSSPNLVKMYMTTRAQMSSIMELIGPELSELSAFELENLQYLTMFTL